MTGQHPVDRICAAVDGELDHDARDRVLAHLVGCDSCRAEAEADRRLKARLAGLADPEPPGDLAQRLLGIPSFATEARTEFRAVPALTLSPASSVFPAGRTRPAQTRPSQARPTQARPTQARPAQGRPAQARPGSIRPAPARSAQAWPAQARVAPAWSGQARLVQAWSGQARLVQARLAQAWPGPVQRAAAVPARAAERTRRRAVVASAAGSAAAVVCLLGTAFVIGEPAQQPPLLRPPVSDFSADHASTVSGYPFGDPAALLPSLGTAAWFREPLSEPGPPGVTVQPAGTTGR